MFFDEMQFVSHCYIVASYQAIFRYSIYQKNQLYIFPVLRLRFSFLFFFFFFFVVVLQDTGIRFPDYCLTENSYKKPQVKDLLLRSFLSTYSVKRLCYDIDISVALQGSITTDGPNNFHYRKSRKYHDDSL